ncbi:MAG: GDP-mannose 4,6-dehydratase [Myxococcaceae bacterium]|nr:GDP-mannose 4,6-dehydratase [Myxococcaceae bacterium]
MKTALVVGSSGQDGTLLTAQLAAADWRVVGVSRAAVTETGVPEAGLAARKPSVDLLNSTRTRDFLNEVRPDAVYYLAAFHHSSDEMLSEEAPALLKRSLEVHVEGFANVLEGVTRAAPRARVFYAASSHVFGAPSADTQDELTPFAPTSIYGISKAAGVEVARFYRSRGLHVSSGLLYNHESPLRPIKFVSQRIVSGAVEAARAAKRKQSFTLELGDLAARVDWGWAPDFTDAMQRIVHHDSADDYVVATGQAHTIEEFCRLAFAAVELDADDYVVERKGRLTRAAATLAGNASRLRTRTGWSPSVTFAEMVNLLVAARLRQERGTHEESARAKAP